MLKFIVILLAAFMGMMLICGVFPALGTSALTVGTHHVPWYWIGLTGLVFAFYKATGK